MAVPPYIVSDINAANKSLKEARAKGDEEEERRSLARIDYLLGRISELKSEQ